jgi:hypothetical protein
MTEVRWVMVDNSTKGNVLPEHTIAADGWITKAHYLQIQVGVYSSKTNKRHPSVVAGTMIVPREQ